MRYWVWMMVLLFPMSAVAVTRSAEITSFARCELSASRTAYQEGLYWHRVLTTVAHPMSQWRYVKVWRADMGAHGLQRVFACRVPHPHGMGREQALENPALAAAQNRPPSTVQLGPPVHEAMSAADSIVHIESEYGMSLNKPEFLANYPRLVAAHRILLTLAH